MCDVTIDNFEDLLPAIGERIRTCAFIAFDTEFTALTVGNENRASLFDSMESRYQKLRSSSMQSIINQVGLSIFHSDSSSNTYTASTYNFYICPRSFGPLDDIILLKASSLEFLSSHNFDFNKFIHKGIGYLNANKASRLSSYLAAGDMFRATERNVTFRDEDLIKEIGSQLAQWLQGKEAAEGTDDNGDKDKSTDEPGSKAAANEIVIDCGHLPKYLVHHEIRAKFSNLWSFARDRDAVAAVGDGDRGITVRLVSAEERKRLSQDPSQDLSGELLEHLTGFSRVVREIIESRKPIVGHNCFTDLVKIYQQFVADLPESYEEFKREINRIFPSVFDTKHLSFELRKQLEVDDSRMSVAFANTNLEELYKSLGGKNNTGRFELMFCPNIVPSKEAEFTKSYGENDCFHEAGFDAFATGFCFIKAAHIAASINYLSVYHMKPLNFHEHLKSMEEFKNQVNIGRAVITYVNFYGPDPEISRPDWLLVQSRSGKTLDPFMLAELLARFGSVDVRQHSRTEVLLAVGNFRVARDILAAFRNKDRNIQNDLNEEDLRVIVYSPLRHGKATRTAGRILSATLSLALISASIYLLRKRI